MRGTAYVIGPFGSGTRGTSSFPYGAEHLATSGYDVTYSDASASLPRRVLPTRWAIGAVHRLLRLPVLDPILELGHLRNADLVVCFLEDNLSVLSPTLRILRRGRRHRASVLVVVWLAEDVSRLSARQRRRWRRRLTAFGRVVVLSSNQVALLESGLDLPAGTVRFVPFGVDPVEPAPAGERDRVFTVGSDLGRDFETYVRALDGRGVRATVLTNTVHRARLGDTGSVAVVGPEERPAYLDMLAAAGIVVSVTRELSYPTGQTALLEAMQCGKPCVVTRSAALDDYVSDGRDVVLVPPGDATALRAAVERLRDDDDLRARLGASAAASAARFTEASMWAGIADCISHP